MLIIILIILFTCLIVYQFYKYFFNKKIVEGLTDATQANPTTNVYAPYDLNNPNNALILAQQNAGNIDVLKRELDQLLSLNQEVQDISGNVVILNEQLQSLIEQQSAAAQQLVGNTPLHITSSGDTNTNVI